MSRGKNWIILCSIAILTIVLAGVSLAVTPVAASAPHISHFTYVTLASTLPYQLASLAAPSLAAQVSFQPSTDSCLLCYSP